jgi:hypothetical protein
MVPNLVANLQGKLVGLGISGSGSLLRKRKETWRQQFESAPGYILFFQPACFVLVEFEDIFIVSYSHFTHWLNTLALCPSVL